MALTVFRTLLITLAICVTTMTDCKGITVINLLETPTLQDSPIVIIKKSLQRIRNRIETELMSIEFHTVYDGLNESQIISLQEAAHMADINYHYKAEPIAITGGNREILEALVFGEAGGEDFVGQCLVAQCIRDTMVQMKTTDVTEIIKKFKYAGNTNKGTSQSCKDAVAFIFDNGGYVVRQRIIYFYAPNLVRSKWHETQDFVIEWGCHRFFDDSGWE